MLSLPKKKFDCILNCFKCIICEKCIHITCTEGNYTQKELDEFNKSTASLKFVCKNCDERLENRDNQEDILGYEKFFIELQSKYYEDMKQQDERARSMKSQFNQLQFECDNLQRKVELNSVSAHIQPNKLPRTENTIDEMAEFRKEVSDQIKGVTEMIKQCMQTVQILVNKEVNQAPQRIK